MGVRYHYIEVDKILKRAVATEMLLFRVHVMYTTWGQWEKKKGERNTAFGHKCQSDL